MNANKCFASHKKADGRASKQDDANKKKKKITDILCSLYARRTKHIQWFSWSSSFYEHPNITAPANTIEQRNCAVHNHTQSQKKKQNGMEKCGRTREKKKRRKMKEEKQVNKEIDKRIISAGACSCKIKSFNGREPQRISYSRRTSAQRRDRSTFPIISLSLFQKKKTCLDIESLANRFEGLPIFFSSLTESHAQKNHRTCSQWHPCTGLKP